MMARLRLITTLARRISDSRRSLLFCNEASHWEIVIGTNTILRELVQLMEESATNCVRFEIWQVHCATAGKRNTNSAPPCGWLCAVRLPPWRLTMP